MALLCAQVLDCAGKHQVLIFVHSRKETAKTAQYLKQTALDNDHLAKFMRDDSASREILQVNYQCLGGRLSAAVAKKIET